MEKTLFYFRENKTVLRYAPILIICLSLFWSIYDILSADSMYFIATGAIYAILAMSIMAAFCFFSVINTEKVINSPLNELLLQKTLKKCEHIAFLLFLTIVISSVFILGANNYSMYLLGMGQTMQTISLSSTLLFVPVVAPFAEKKYGIGLFIASILSLGIPYFLYGSECYSVLPELVLRIAIAIAYIVVYLSMEKSFELETRIRNSNSKLLSMLVNLIELRDLKSGEHVSKVQSYTAILLDKLSEMYPEYNITSFAKKIITEASSMHDIGKLMIPDNILFKPTKLSDEEFEIMKTHTVKGKEIIESLPEEIIGKDFLRYGVDICEYHHEKYDGKGYPKGISGEDIPIWSQIVSIADCYEALTNDRSYKKAFAHEDAIKMIMDGECGVFNPKVVDCFSACEKELKACLENK